MWTRSLIALSGAALMTFGSIAPASAAGGLSDNAQAFLAAVRKNFSAWETSHKGRLTLAEIETDMQNPAIKGEDAAALAALMWAARPTKAEPQPRSYILADFDAIEKTLMDGEKPDRAYVATFAEGVRKIAAERRELFADKEPHLDAIRQQKDLDCYFNSAVGALAKERPQLIVDMIRPNADGSYSVTFPGHAAQKIPAPTDAEIAAYTDSSDGLWFNVLEKAYGEIRKIASWSLTNEPLDAAALHGGSPREVITLLTGHQTKNIALPIKTGRPADNQLLNQVRTEISSALDAHMAVATGKFHHAYAVVAYDGKTDTFTLHNPYDRAGQEKLPDGDGATRDEKGFFTMATAKFVENFNNVVIEETAVASR